MKMLEMRLESCKVSHSFFKKRGEKTRGLSDIELFCSQFKYREKTNHLLRVTQAQLLLDQKDNEN